MRTDRPTVNAPWPTLHLRALIARKRDELASLETAVSVLEREAPHVEPDAEPAPIVKPRALKLAKPTPPAPRRARASVESDVSADVLAVLKKARGPLKGSELCDRIPGVDTETAIRAVRVLVKAGQVIKTGATSSMRYAVPEFANADA